MAITKFSFPTSITFGPGARTEVAAHLKSQGVKRPLIVTDKGLANLPDVSITAPTNGQVLIYNSTTKLWTPGAN